MPTSLFALLYRYIRAEFIVSQHGLLVNQKTSWDIPFALRCLRAGDCTLPSPVLVYGRRSGVLTVSFFGEYPHHLTNYRRLAFVPICRMILSTTYYCGTTFVFVVHIS